MTSMSIGFASGAMGAMGGGASGQQSSDGAGVSPVLRARPIGCTVVAGVPGAARGSVGGGVSSECPGEAAYPYGGQTATRHGGVAALPGTLVVARGRLVEVWQAVPLTNQVQDLLRAKRWEEATALAETAVEPSALSPPHLPNARLNTCQPHEPLSCRVTTRIQACASNPKP